MELLFYAIAFYALLFAIRYLLVFLQIRKIIIQCPQSEIQPEDAVPGYLKSLFEQVGVELAHLGFEFCSFLQVTPMPKLDFPKDSEVLLYHPALKTYAMVGIKQVFEPTDVFDIRFFTFFQDQSLLLTLNGTSYGVVGQVPNTVLEDPQTADTQVHWQAHEAKLQQLITTKIIADLAPTAFLDALRHHYQRYFEHQVKAGQFSQLPGQPLFRRSFWACWQMVPKLMKGASKENAIAKQRKQLAITNPSLKHEIPVELEVRQFQRIEQLQNQGKKSKLSLWVTLASFVVFIAAYTSLMQPVQLAIFIGALLLHEGGHVLAMKLCGYRDTSMLFLPFLGALATANKDNATVTQKFWVSFAGPIPGLLLGIGLMLFTRGGHYPEWVSEASWILIGLNLFNLLPVYPLDGGQIADLLVFSRIPLLGLLFKSLGVLLLILFGLGRPMMLGFAVLIGLTIPTSYRSDRLNAKLRKEFSQIQTGDQESLLSAIFMKLKEFGYGALPFHKKRTLAKTLMLRHSDSYSKRTTKIFLTLIYAVSLIGGLMGALEGVLPGWWRSIPMTFVDPTASAKQDIKKITATINAKPNDMESYLLRAHLQFGLKNYRAAIADTSQVIEAKPDLHNATLIHRAYTLRSAARRKLGDISGAAADTQQFVALYRKAQLAAVNQRIQANPDKADFYLDRAQLFAEFGEHKKAIADCNKALQIDLKNAWAYFQRGSSWAELKASQQALSDVDQAIHLDPDFMEAYELRAEIRRQRGDKAGADADSRKAEELFQKEDSE
jgi:Zn-dependent protease